jgi:nucleoside-diphosphate-sugar epimerase
VAAVGGPCVVAGCGYVGTRLARAWRQQGGTVTALVRTEESAARLRALDIEAIAVDLDEETATPASVAGAWLYYLVPPPSVGTTDPRIRRFLQRLDADNAPAGLVLLSTTGVYGDCDGAWIDESAPLAPRADRARRRVDAEQAARDWSARSGIPLIILRVPGIYGPGRLPVARLRQGAPVLRDSESPWSNRVHVDDLVAAALAAPMRGRPGSAYNISDGHPSTMTDYFKRVADAMGLPRPPEIDAHAARSQLQPGMQSYLAESRRIDNTRMRTELGVVLRYPDLDAGLAAALAEQESGRQPS